MHAGTQSRSIQALSAFVVAFILSSCGSPAADLRLIEPRLDFDRDVARVFAELLDDESSVDVRLVGSASMDESSLEALLADRADIALVSNNQHFHHDIHAVIPLYSNVLHIGYYGDPVPDDVTIFDILVGKTVFAGPPGSPSRLMLEDLSEERVVVDSINYVEIGEVDCPEVIIIYAPISPRLLQEPDPNCGPLHLFSLGNPKMIGTGSIVDAATLLNPHLEAFVIPAGTYPTIDREAGPIVTFAVDKLLVARSDVPEHVIYDLISEIVRLRPALAAQLPGLFNRITEDFSPADSTFIIHPGAQSFLQRDAPSVYERYSGIAEVVVTIFIGILSGAFALIRIYNIRRKNRIDVFYKDAIAIRESIDATTTPYARKVAIDKVKELQAKAFDFLVDEKVAADESFRIFITLSNDIIDDLRRDPE